MHKPLVIVPCCVKEIGLHPYFAVQVKYVEAVLIGAGCMPLILPSVANATDIDAILGMADGVMLTGSPSNVHPRHFGQEVYDITLPLDAKRDGTTLPLIPAVLKRGIPLFGICRGTQEINVALGGSLYQAVQEVPGKMDHREEQSQPLDVQYAPRHRVRIEAGGRLSQILYGAKELMVNSLHGQAVDRLAAGLRVEAYADDGLIEAFSVEGARGFTLALQWHPEWRVAESPDSMKLFEAFGAACRQYQSEKHGGAHAS